jgi:hypothetical protein
MIPNASEDVEQQELSTLLLRMQNITITLECNLADSYKTKRPLSIESSNCTPSYLTKLIENLCPHKKSAHQCLKQPYLHFLKLGSNTDTLQ